MDGMTDDTRLQNMEQELQRHGSKLDDIAKTLERIAVQDERLRQVETRADKLEIGLAALCDSNIGILPKIRDHQSSCPREQVRWLWVVIIPQSFFLIGVGIKLMVGE